MLFAQACELPAADDGGEGTGGEGSGTGSASGSGLGTTTGSGNSGGSMNTDALTANLKTVVEKMVPASMANTQAAGLQGEGNPCADSSGFFDYQPNLIKLYIYIAQAMMDSTSQIL